MTRHSTQGILPLLVAAALLLTACSNDTSPATGDEPSTAPSSGATDEATDIRPAWRHLASMPDFVPLAAGSYGLTANGVSDRTVVVRAPEGYMNLGGWTFVTAEPFHAMGFQTATIVPPDPCGSHGQFAAPADPGPSVKDLAQALVAQKGAVTSEPVPVKVDGHRGLYLTYQVAKGIDVRKCGAREFTIFSNGPGSWYLEASRERAAIWILDVDGERLVLAWVAVPGVTRAQMREMTHMVQSARFAGGGQGLGDRRRRRRPRGRQRRRNSPDSGT